MKAVVFFAMALIAAMAVSGSDLVGKETMLPYNASIWTPSVYQSSNSPIVWGRNNSLFFFGYDPSTMSLLSPSGINVELADGHRIQQEYFDKVSGLIVCVMEAAPKYEANGHFYPKAYTIDGSVVWNNESLQMQLSIDGGIGVLDGVVVMLYVDPSTNQTGVVVASAFTGEKLYTLAGWNHCRCNAVSGVCVVMAPKSAGYWEVMGFQATTGKKTFVFHLNSTLGPYSLTDDFEEYTVLRGGASAGTSTYVVNTRKGFYTFISSNYWNYASGNLYQTSQSVEKRNNITTTVTQIEIFNIAANKDAGQRDVTVVQFLNSTLTPVFTPSLFAAESTSASSSSRFYEFYRLKDGVRISGRSLPMPEGSPSWSSFFVGKKLVVPHNSTHYSTVDPWATPNSPTAVTAGSTFVNQLSSNLIYLGLGDQTLMWTNRSYVQFSGTAASP